MKHGRAEYFVTVIIPVFNQESIGNTLERGRREGALSQSMEILLINDGSTDATPRICRQYAEKYPNVQYFSQENKGVSAARNLGIQNARGKYLFFLDADDCLAPGTIEHVAEFFDSVYDETDLVTYPIETFYKGKKQQPHFRYRYLKESGVYSLWEHPYIGQTTMNIAVKNRYGNNVLFDESQTFSEDQKYCCQVLQEKMQMGYCSQGSYLYYRSKNSSSGKLSGACFIFEQCMSFFEQLFEPYEEVPAAFQGLFVNDVYWKLAGNLLFPYHYDEAEFDRAVRRISGLLGRCGNDVILNHPQIDFFEKYYLLRLKGKNTLRWEVNREHYGLYDGGKAVLLEQSMEMVITKVRVEHQQVEIEGFLKTVFFQFYEEKPVLFAIENDGQLAQKLHLFSSAHNYYHSHEKTQRFWAVRYSCRMDAVKRFYFEVQVGGCWFPVHYYFMPLTPFSHKYKRYRYEKGSLCLEIDQKNEWFLSPAKPKECRRIWLYYDCKGVEEDNGYLQFQHDICKNDGIERYYIRSDRRQAKKVKKRYCVPFGGRRHKRLFLQAEKIITAYIEYNNVIPFSPREYEAYAGQFRFETVYLQHGVLHIDMPWKYSPEKIMADRVVVSTRQEARMFEQNGFHPQQLWRLKMPRLEGRLAVGEKKRKLLFAPSWRSYLVGDNVDGSWELLEDKFMASSYFRNIQSFLNLEGLDQVLEKYGYTLEIKLHPIFTGYQKCFLLNSERTAFVSHTDAAESYSLLITDVSSFLYDFLYQKVPVMLFLPDWMEFQAGMNGYRKLNVSKEQWENIEREPKGALKRLMRFLETGECMSFQADFFEGEDVRERIYKENMSDTMPG